jgi:hypothetical protein
MAANLFLCEVDYHLRQRCGRQRDNIRFHLDDVMCWGLY